MQTGDIVVCVASRGYYLTTGKEYTVKEYIPEKRMPAFTWPPYVVVDDDSGNPVTCRDHRFRLKGDTNEQDT